MSSWHDTHANGNSANPTTLTIHNICFLFNETTLQTQSFLSLCLSSANMPIMHQSANLLQLGSKARRVKGTSAMKDLISSMLACIHACISIWDLNEVSSNLHNSNVANPIIIRG